eukprot:gene19038-36661_t
MRVGSGEQARGTFFTGQEEGTRGLQAWIRFVCLLRASDVSPESGTVTRDLRRMEQLPVWREMMETGGEKA